VSIKYGLQICFSTNLSQLKLSSVDIVTITVGVWLQTGYGLVNGCIDHVNTRFVITSSYSAIAISTLYTSLQHSLSLFPACCVLTSRSMATASNSGDYSASRAQVLVTAARAEHLSISSYDHYQISTQV
jgi:hypothetical protein